MIITIVSDIHANLPALKTAVNNLGTCDKIASLGDIIGYGPNPVECIDWVKKNTDISIKGNHDSALCNDSDLNKFNEYAREAIYISKKIIPELQYDYICKLPLTDKIDDILFVHASPYAPESWGYIMSKAQMYYILKEQKHKVTFIGHSHVPFIAELKDDDMRMLGGKMEMKPGAKYLVNVGSVGQPRDGDNRLSYAVFDTDKASIEIKRIKYDFKETQRMMRELGLPEFLIERLEYGR